MTAPVPAEADPAEVAPVCRPTVLRWVRYCLGGTLPAKNHTWVLFDVTCRTWWLRHFAHWLMGIVPALALYLAFMPASLGVRLLTGLTFSGGILMFAWVNIIIDSDRRAVRAGYPSGYAERIRSAQAVERQRSANYQRRERIAARQARRRG